MRSREGGNVGTYLRHLVRRPTGVFCFGDLQAEFWFWQVEMLVSERKWDQLVAAGWPPDLASEFLIDWLVQVPWRNWEAGLAPWVVETSDWPYLNEKKWPRTKVNHPVISVRPKRLISVHMFSTGPSFFAPLRAVSSVVPKGVQLASAKVFLGPDDASSGLRGSIVVLSDAAKQIWESVMTDRDAVAWTRVDAIDPDELRALRGGRDLV